MLSSRDSFNLQPSVEATDPATALALDEQLARQLALEDEQEVQRHAARRGSEGHHASGQSWSRRGAGSQPPQQDEGDKGTQDFHETVSRIAECECIGLLSSMLKLTMYGSWQANFLLICVEGEGQDQRDGPEPVCQCTSDPLYVH